MPNGDDDNDFFWALRRDPYTVHTARETLRLHARHGLRSYVDVRLMGLYGSSWLYVLHEYVHPKQIQHR